MRSGKMSVKSVKFNFLIDSTQNVYIICKANFHNRPHWNWFQRPIEGLQKKKKKKRKQRNYLLCYSFIYKCKSESVFGDVDSFSWSHHICDIKAKGNESDIRNIDFDELQVLKTQNYRILPTCDSFPLIMSHEICQILAHHEPWGGGTPV